MSEKKWKFDSRVPHKERGGRRGKGSGFPRHGMNEYEGERLAMGRHRFSNHRTQTHNKRHGWASLHKKHIEGLLKKYLNKPFNEMLNEFYAKSKALRRSNRQRMIKTQRYFSGDVESDYTRFYILHGGERKYFIDDNGILRLREKNTEAIRQKKLTRKQKTFNRQVSIPTFNIPTDNFLHLKKKYETPDLYVGDYFAVVDGEICKVPIYTSPKTENEAPNTGRIPVGGFNFEGKFNDVFWKYTYKKKNEYKISLYEHLEKLELENNPENAERILRLRREISNMRDWIYHGHIELDFYTLDKKKSKGNF